MRLKDQFTSIDLERLFLAPVISLMLVFSTLGLFRGSHTTGGLVGTLTLCYRILLVLFYVMAVAMLLARGAAKAKSKGILPRIAAYAGTFAPLLLPFVSSSPVWAPLAAVGVVLQVLGLGFALYSLGTLRRSFGVAPQVRTLVRTGPYRVIRHPLYVGEFVSLLGAVLVGPSWEKALILVACAAIQVYRVLQEESLFETHDPEYAAYMRTTKRFVPGLF